MSNESQPVFEPAPKKSRPYYQANAFCDCGAEMLGDFGLLPDECRTCAAERESRYFRKLADWCERELSAMTKERDALRAGLQFYADGDHFYRADPSAWDTVSGEPPNWLDDEAGTASVEDGSIAKMVLNGELTAAEIEVMKGE